MSTSTANDDETLRMSNANNTTTYTEPVVIDTQTLLRLHVMGIIDLYQLKEDTDNDDDITYTSDDNNINECDDESSY
jgi:hypothetical protein